jgi:cbb3-type cytochrome oxidase subunit 1
MLARRLIRTAIAFFVLGVVLGVYMGAAQDFRFIHVHAHINLLGWVALGLVGLLYAQFPALQRHWMAGAHYWLHTVGLIVFMGSFALGNLLNTKFVPVIAIGATSVALGVLLLAVNVFRGLEAAAAPA